MVAQRSEFMSAILRESGGHVCHILVCGTFLPKEIVDHPFDLTVDRVLVCGVMDPQIQDLVELVDGDFTAHVLVCGAPSGMVGTPSPRIVTDHVICIF